MDADTVDPSDYGISFVSLPGMSGVEVIDPIERHRFRLDFSTDVEPTAANTDAFLFPVDDAITIQTSRIDLPCVVGVFVRTADGELIAEAEHHATERVEAGRYVLEVCSPIKLYVEVDAAVTVESGQDEMSITFDAPTSVRIGARSAHEHPEATLTTTTAPQDIMAAVSAFGSALKTTSPERSFPTLRGHPPRVEVGESLVIPAELEPPDTGIAIEIPPTLDAIYTAAPLSYYLGARLKSGTDARLTTETGFTEPLAAGEALADGVERVLKQTFVLDAATRTEGLYPVTLHEREVLESRLPLDFEELYDRPIAERLASYLRIPYDTVADVVPRWGLTAHVVPEPTHVEMLPYLVDDLALIRVQSPDSVATAQEPTAVTASSGEFTRSTGATAASTGSFVQPPPTEAAEQVWVGDGAPLGASKAIPAAFENRLERTPSTTDIEITVVCNDAAMLEEGAVLDDIYGSRDVLPFEVTFHRDLDRETLAEVLTTPTDFLHYIGHIDHEGFECADGKLDIEGIGDVGVSAFLLNACQSYRQGRHLIEAGGIGGIVTLSEVINSSAVAMGETLARLLNAGFPLYAALKIARGSNIMGGRYTVVGDGRVALSQPQSVPHLCELESTGNGYDFTYDSYPTSHVDLGSMTFPILNSNEKHFLVSNRIDELAPTDDELLEFLTLEEKPLRIDEDLTWSDQIDSL